MLLMLAFAVGIFGIVSATNVLAATRETSTQINNVVPTFDTNTVESWDQSYTGTVDVDSRTASSTTYPTNEGTSVTFTGTGNDSNNDDYYLIVCDSDEVSANNSAAPDCGSGTLICVSDATTDETAATCSKSTTGISAETVNWYSYVCDHNSSSICSIASTTSHGGTHAELGTPGSSAGSPFHVNHIPTFTATDISAVNPGTSPTFVNTSDADTDTNGTQDTFTLIVCSGESDQGGVTSAYNSKTDTCTGGETLCNDTLNDPTEQATCQDGRAITSIPTAHASNYTVQFYVRDSHGFATSVQSKDFAVNDVVPELATYATEAIVLLAGVGDEAVTFNVQLSDDNGDNDPTNVRFVLFDTGTTDYQCGADEKDCYIINSGTIDPSVPPGICTTTPAETDTRSTAGSGKTALGTDKDLTIECNFGTEGSPIEFNANYSAGWNIRASVTDGNGVEEFADSSDFASNSLLSIGASSTTPNISYGTVAVGALSSHQVTTLENLGNQILDFQLTGTDMSDSGSFTIPRAQQAWEHESGTFTWADGNTLLETASTPAGVNGCVDRDMAVRAVAATGTEDESISWIIKIPAAQESGSYTGVNHFTAVTSSTCTGS